MRNAEQPTLPGLERAKGRSDGRRSLRAAPPRAASPAGRPVARARRRDDWRIDDKTRAVVRSGLLAARAALEACNRSADERPDADAA